MKILKYKKIFWLSLLFLILSGCGQINLSETTSVVINEQTFIVEVVKELATQQQGLAGRNNLAANQGMLFIFPNKQIRSFWMKDMNFNIDLIWLDDEQIVGWQENMPAPTANTSETELINYLSPQSVDKVLELSAGTIANLNLKLGDRVVYQGDF